MTLLTIGIPTYNRKNIIQENILHLFSDDLLSDNDVNLVVSDNCSTDGTFDFLSSFVSASPYPHKVILNKNNSNLGVFPNIFKLFELSTSRYILITSDEEHLIKENLVRIKSFLELERPSFVSPQFFRNGRLYRGSRRSSILPRNTWMSASFFTSGLIFDRIKTLDIIQRLRHLLLADHIHYAQSLLVAELMICHPRTQWFLNIPSVTKIFSEPTTISSNSFFSYSSLPGRWESFKAVDLYFRSRSIAVTSVHDKQLFCSFATDNARHLYRTFLHAITQYSPSVLDDFRVGVFRCEFGLLAPIILLTLALLKHLKRTLCRVIS